jgi:hypothetical protein
MMKTQYSYRRSQSADLPHCIQLIHGRSLYAEQDLKDLVVLWTELLEREAAVSAVVEERTLHGTRIVGFGFSVFVKDLFIWELRQRSSSFRNRGSRIPLARYLLDKYRAGTAPFLHKQGIDKAQRQDGLNYLGLHYGWAEDLLPDARGQVLACLRDSLFEYHRGFNFRTFVKEVFGISEAHQYRAFGFDIWLDGCDAGEADRGNPAAYLVGTTRERALETGREAYAVRRLFEYQRPLLTFTPGQRNLLQAALQIPDSKDLALYLRITDHTVKKSFDRIYERVNAQYPELLAASNPDRSAQQRGKEKRRLLLDYLRQHPEALLPANEDSQRS